MVVSLSVKGLQKAYGTAQVLKGLSLDLYEGEILALLGPNGSGKTTFIKILATLLIKDAGTVEILGYDLDRHEREIQHQIGYVGQDTERSAYARLTVRENLHFFGALRGLSKAHVNTQIKKLADYFDFHDSIDKHFTYLSGGQKQTVVIMRSLLHDPPMIYLDEPTKGLDPIIAKKIRAFLKRYVSEERKTLLLTSHILSEVDELASRVALIHNGTIPLIDTATSLKQALGVHGFIELHKPTLQPQVAERIATLPPVVNCNDQDPEWVAFGISDMVDGTEAIIRVLREENVQSVFRYRNVSLEDAFIHHIGALADKFEV